MDYEDAYKAATLSDQTPAHEQVRKDLLQAQLQVSTLAATTATVYTVAYTAYTYRQVSCHLLDAWDDAHCGHQLNGLGICNQSIHSAAILLEVDEFRELQKQHSLSGWWASHTKTFNPGSNHTAITHTPTGRSAAICLMRGMASTTATTHTYM
jgi:hypothetical protein